MNTKTITAFVAKSFAETDRSKVQIIEKLLSAFRPQGFNWQTAEQSEVELVSLKARRLIQESDVFVAVFTRRHPIHATQTRWNRVEALLGKKTTLGWTCAPWLLQESGYALALNKPFILFRESGVELPSLQGDLEYIEFDPYNPTPAIQHANEMLNSLIADLRGISVSTNVEAVHAKPALSQEDSSKGELSITGYSIKDALWDELKKKNWKKFDELLPKLEEEDPGSAVPSVPM